MDLFNGTWKLDVENARVWDAESRRYVPDEVGEEIVTLTIEDGVQDYEVLYGVSPTVRMGYRARYDDAEWVPYVVRGITGVAEGETEEEAVARFKARIKADSGTGARNMKVGEPYGLVRLVYVDERTHYRIAKHGDGRPQAAMLRRMSEDGQSYKASVMDVNGVVYRIRPFLRVG